MALLAAWQDAAKVKNSNGDTPLYLALENTAPEAATNALGQTPAQVSRADKVPNLSWRREPNPHLIASFRCIQEAHALVADAFLGLDHRLARVVHAVCQAGCVDGPDGRGDVQAWVAAAVADGLLVPDPELHPAARAAARRVRAFRRASRAGTVHADLAGSQSKD